MNGDDNWFVRRHNKTPPLIDTFIVSEMPTRLYALFDYGLTMELAKNEVLRDTM